MQALYVDQDPAACVHGRHHHLDEVWPCPHGSQHFGRLCNRLQADRLILARLQGKLQGLRLQGRLQRVFSKGSSAKDATCCMAKVQGARREGKV